MGDLKLIHFIQVDAFWCFVGFMDRVASNFDFDQGKKNNNLMFYF